jgi:hypothetical protein
MRIEVAECKLNPGDWRVEMINEAGEGEVCTAIFVGPRAQARAEAYATGEHCCEGRMTRPALTAELQAIERIKSRAIGAGLYNGLGVAGVDLANRIIARGIESLQAEWTQLLADLDSKQVTRLREDDDV